MTDGPALSRHRWAGNLASMKARIALVTLLALALIAVAALVLVSRFDPEAAAQAVRDYVRDRYGRELTIDGPLKLQIWPGLGISIPRAQLSETGSDVEAARFASADAEIAWLPLMRGSAIVERLRITGLHLRVERRADGSHNIDNLLSPAAMSVDAAPGDEPTAKAPRVEIGRVEITEASLEYRDPASQMAVWFDDIELKFDELAARMVTPFSLRARMVAAPDGPSILMKLSGTLDIDPVKRTFGLRGAEANARGFIGGRPLDLNARARRAQLRLAASGPSLRLESFAIGLRAAAASWSVEASHVKGSLLDFDQAKLALSATSIEASARGKLGRESFESTLSVPELIVAESASRGRAAEATLRLRSEDEIELRLSLDGWAGGPRDLAINRAALTVESSHGSLNSAAKIAGALRADLDTASLNLSQISGNVALEPGGGRPALKLPIAGSAHAELQTLAMKTELETRLDNSLIRLQTDYAPRSRDSALKVGLHIDQLDGDRTSAAIGPIIAAAQTPKSPPAAPPEPRAGPAAADTAAPANAAGPNDPPPVLQALAEADWQASAEIGRLRLGSVHAAALSARVRAGDGVLRLRGFSASVFRGTLTAEADLLPAAGLFHASLRAREIDTADWLRETAGADFLEGRLEVRADLNGRLSSDDWIKSLAGDVNFRLSEGRLNGIDLPQVAKQSPRGSGAREATVDHSTLLGGASEFSLLSARFSLRDAVASSRNILIETPLLRVSGAGAIDLDQLLLDASLRVGPRLPTGNRVLGALSRVGLPIRVRGPLRAPSWSVDPPVAGNPRASP